MMVLSVNGTERDVGNDVASPADLLQHLGLPREKVAVVVNETVIRRDDLASTRLNAGDQVEVITMVGGG